MADYLLRVWSKQAGVRALVCLTTDLVSEAAEGDQGDDEVGLVGRFTGLSLAVTDLAEVHARLSAAGVRFRSAPERQSWGGWLETFVDPASNALQLVQ